MLNAINPLYWPHYCTAVLNECPRPSVDIYFPRQFSTGFVHHDADVTIGIGRMVDPIFTVPIVIGVLVTQNS